MERGHSNRCQDLTTYWDGRACVDCDRKAGHEVTENCGYSDDGGIHDLKHRPCAANTFNDGSSAKCRACSSCEATYEMISPCTSVADTKCKARRKNDVVSSTVSNVDTLSTLRFPFKEKSSFGTPAPSQYSSDYSLSWVAPLALFITFVILLSAYIIYRNWRKGQSPLLRVSASSLINRQPSPLSASAGDVEVENILSPIIQSAPLQAVLDDLDVLEELVILLDPESHGVKNTKHLASHCQFTSAWITYTYSMKDSKSPLKAVLEVVSSKNPDWTVGHLARLLRLIERNDAIAVLTNLQVTRSLVK